MKRIVFARTLVCERAYSSRLLRRAALLAVLTAALVGSCFAQSGTLVVGPGTLDEGTSLYQAANSITNSTNSFTVQNSASVIFMAGSSITLMPGFHAVAGTASITFHAYINPGQQSTSITAQPPAVSMPAKEYIHVGGQVIAIENN